jgi:hypothetical protein
MLFVFGLRLYGRVDAVPGQFHVATEFYHVQFLPVVPMQTWLITSQDGSGWQGVKIPLCRKSVAVAWARGVSALATVVAGIWALAEAGGRTGGDWQAPAALTLVAALVFAATKFSHAINRAICERACELARLAGYRERAVAEIRALYGEGGEGAGDEGSTTAPGSQADGAPAAADAAQMFFVTGRDGSSGQEVCLTVWASDAQAARAEIAGRGISVPKPAPVCKKRRPAGGGETGARRNTSTELTRTA